MRCVYCNLDKPNVNSLRNHERLCKQNPNRQEHPRGNLGKIGWNRGSTKFSDERILKASQKCSNTMKGRKGRSQTTETKEKLSRIRVESLNENAFYSKRTKYKNVTLDSSYELILAEDLDRNGIIWIRPKSLVWLDGSQKRRYIPDFYLPEFDVYLDPKNDYLIKKDQRKIDAVVKFNNVKIFILTKNELNWSSIRGKIG